MSEEEFYVEHTETGLVHAEDVDKAYEKARQGESETGWNTLDLVVERAGEEESTEPVKLNEQETTILRQGGSVEVGGRVIALDENAEDKHGLGDGL